MLLSLDTSSKTCTVALFDNGELVTARHVEGKGKSASLLAPTISGIFAQENRQMEALKWVAVTTGPGSFTGLRVGVTTAKLLAYSLPCKVIGINTLSAIAANAFESTDLQRLSVVLDAQRNQVFHGLYSRGTVWNPSLAKPISISERNELPTNISVTGSGLERYPAESLNSLQLTDQSLWPCTAESVGRHALARIENGEQDDFWKLLPDYFRLSAAEEKLLEK